MISEPEALSRWDVVVALFPFTDVDVKKPRPVLVISDQAFNASHGHVIGAMITTGSESQWPSDCPITDLTACGLNHRSVVRWKLFTLPTALTARRIGALALGDQRRAEKQLAAILPMPGTI
jgi:mRNA-degrading endonuclease toxin of MazEF toxin-antitoxin module